MMRSKNIIEIVSSMVLRLLLFFFVLFIFLVVIKIDTYAYDVPRVRVCVFTEGGAPLDFAGGVVEWRDDRPRYRYIPIGERESISCPGNGRCDAICAAGECGASSCWAECGGREQVSINNFGASNDHCVEFVPALQDCVPAPPPCWGMIWSAFGRDEPGYAFLQGRSVTVPFPGGSQNRPRLDPSVLRGDHSWGCSQSPHTFQAYINGYECTATQRDFANTRVTRSYNISCRLANDPPSIISVSMPNDCITDHTFEIHARDPDGGDDVNQMRLRIGANTYTIVINGTDAWDSPNVARVSVVPGSCGNNVCVSGNDVRVLVRVTGLNAPAGQTNVQAWARDRGGLNSGWFNAGNYLAGGMPNGTVSWSPSPAEPFSTSTVSYRVTRGNVATTTCRLTVTGDGCANINENVACPFGATAQRVINTLDVGSCNAIFTVTDACGSNPVSSWLSVMEPNDPPTIVITDPPEDCVEPTFSFFIEDPNGINQLTGNRLDFTIYEQYETYYELPLIGDTGGMGREYAQSGGISYVSSNVSCTSLTGQRQFRDYDDGRPWDIFLNFDNSVTNCVPAENRIYYTGIEIQGVLAYVGIGPDVGGMVIDDILDFMQLNVEVEDDDGGRGRGRYRSFDIRSVPDGSIYWDPSPPPELNAGPPPTTADISFGIVDVKSCILETVGKCAFTNPAGARSMICPNFTPHGPSLDVGPEWGTYVGTVTVQYDEGGVGNDCNVIMTAERNCNDCDDEVQTGTAFVASPWLLTVHGDTYSYQGYNSGSDPLYMGVLSDTIMDYLDVTYVDNIGYFSSYILSRDTGNNPSYTSHLNYILGSYTDQNTEKFTAGMSEVYSYLRSLFHDPGNINLVEEETYTISSFTDPGRRSVYFIAGNLNINSNIISNSGVIIVAGGNVTVANGVTHIDAYILSDGNFNSGSSVANRLDVYGGVIASNVTFDRQVADSDPSESIKYDPKYLALFKDIFGENYSFVVKEWKYSSPSGE